MEGMTENKTDYETKDANEYEAETEYETESETRDKTEDKSESVSGKGEAAGKTPTAVKWVKKQRKLRTPVILDGLVTFVGKKAGRWKGLKDRVVARRLNRIRVGERCRNS